VPTDLPVERLISDLTVDVGIQVPADPEVLDPSAERPR
jgi:hypothetical protein